MPFIISVKSLLIGNHGIPCGKDMLCSGLGGKMFFAVYVESHYLVDFQNGSNQVHF